MLHLLATFNSMPWAVEPSVLTLMCSIVDRWATGAKLGPDELATAVGEAPEAAVARRSQAQALSGSGVAVVPVYGVLAHRAYSVENVSRPLTSTEALASQFMAAAADPEVDTIVMDIDSPGGSVFGVEELANTLASIRASGKRLVAVANNTAASGAYWVASQADEVIVTPSGMVGSIGVIVPYTDTSAMKERIGVRQEFISYGRFKAEGHRDGPLTDELRTHLQSMVDTYGSAFTRAVARGRGVTVDAVRGEAFGEGRMKTARDAKDSGMVDGIATLEQVIARERKGRPDKSGKAGMRSSLADLDIQIMEA